MSDPHPFSEFIRALGRGPTLSRPLTREEARSAMAMILAGDVEPVQLGAFLMLLRYRTETPEELAGFIEAVRETIDLPSGARPPDLDWPSYADRHKQLPWFTLAALTLAQNGVRVLMHGIPGESEGYMPTRSALAAIDIKPCTSIAQAFEHLDQTGFAYLPIESFAPELYTLFGLRPFFGLRSTVNSLSRALNPLGANAQIQGVFHPNYRNLHIKAGHILEQPEAVVFKGGGGEGQRNPDKPCQSMRLEGGEIIEEDWPALIEGPATPWRDEEKNTDRIASLWRGELDHPPAVAAVTGTLAMTLKLLGRAATQGQAEEAAREMWENRSP